MSRTLLVLAERGVRPEAKKQLKDAYRNFVQAPDPELKIYFFFRIRS